MILDLTQKICDKLYEKYGATDKVIYLQVKINTARAKMNKPDKKQFVSDDGFSQ